MRDHGNADQVGANIMRSRALSKTTGSSARPLLLLTSKNNSSSNRDVLRAFCGSFSGTTVGGVARDTVNVKGRGGGDKVEADRRRSTVRGSSTESGVQHGARHNGTGRVGGGKRRRWLLTLARFMARPREFERRRAAAVRAFTPQKFRQEWELFWELLDPMFDAFDTTTAVRCATNGGKGKFADSFRDALQMGIMGPVPTVES